MDKSIRFWDRFANRYSKQAIADPDAYQQKLDLTQQYFTPHSSVMEFGCGTGSTALIHAPHVKDIVALDSSKKMIEIANSKVQDSGTKNVEFITGTIFDLPHSSESFDSVLGLNILHLVKDLDATVKKSYDLLKPGGIFVTGTACLGEEPRTWVRWLIAIGGKLGLIPVANFFDNKRLLQSFSKAGFKILKKLQPGKSKYGYFIIAQK